MKMKKGITTKTYISSIGHKVSQIRTTNDYLILYLLGKYLLGKQKNGTVIDIDRENMVIRIKKNAGWTVVSEDSRDLFFTEQILKTDDEWCRDVAKKI